VGRHSINLADPIRIFAAVVIEIVDAAVQIQIAHFAQLSGSAAAGAFE
jgi:hypothetical protein